MNVDLLRGNLFVFKLGTVVGLFPFVLMLQFAGVIWIKGRLIWLFIFKFATSFCSRKRQLSGPLRFIVMNNLLLCHVIFMLIFGVIPLLLIGIILIQIMGFWLFGIPKVTILVLRNSWLTELDTGVWSHVR